MSEEYGFRNRHERQHEPAALAGIEPVATVKVIEHLPDGLELVAIFHPPFNVADGYKLYSAATVERLVQERDAARDHANRLGDQMGAEARISDAQLAASQAREQQLREALKALQQGFPQTHQINAVIRHTLSLPQDDIALRQWGAKLLREMADGYAHGAKDADKDSRVFLSEANARCAIHLHRKADELTEGKP